MKYIKLAVIAILFGIIHGCTYSASYLNRDQDKQEGKKVTDQLFDDLKNKNYDATFGLFSKKFFDVTPKDKLKNIFTFTQDKLGDLKSSEVFKWQTKIITGTNPSSDYEFLFKNRYQKYPAEVDIILAKDSGGKVKIISYRINSDGFFAK